MTNTPMRLMSLQLRELILQLPKEHTNHILVTMASKMPSHEQHIGDYGEQDAVLLKKRSPVHPRTVHGQERGRISISHEQHIGDYSEQDAVLLKKRSPVHPRTVHGQERPYKHVYCDDEYPDDVGEPSAACTDPSASSRTHEPHIGDYGEQDAVLLKKRSPVHPRTVHGQERPYKHVYCDDEYPDDVGEPSAACTDPSASSRTHEPHIGDYGEQDAVLLKKRSPVHPRTVHGQERPYKHASNLEKLASADVHPVRVAGAVPEDVFFEHISGAGLSALVLVLFYEYYGRCPE
ncbi:unnamed protein product [Pieris macdunnoughi]|uniref:Uncharacterized protein n=1 Tax=Pieris macdunnoughi TaxID=345717 RepID=A0A821TH44_9NEOP|nr:unnamed protein product [Pieris macdunnoughi]